MKEIKVVSFDVGNTLIRLGNDGFCAEFRNKTGLSLEVLSPLFFEHFLTKNSSLHDAVYKVCGIIGYDNPQKLIDEFEPAPAFLFEDTIPVLEQLLIQGITMVAISNCTPWEAGGIETFGLDRYLRGVFYSYAIGAAKPDPAIFIHVQKAVGALPENVLHVGDSYFADVQGAMGVGWQAALLDRDSKSTEYANGPGKIPIIRSLRELMPVVKPC